MNNEEILKFVEATKIAIKYYEDKITYNEKMKTTSLHIYGKEFRDKPKYKGFEKEIAKAQKKIDEYKELIKTYDEC